MELELPYDAFLRAVKESTDTNHAFLLGAGTSITSQVQSASDCIWEWKKNIFITKNPSLSQQYSHYKSETVQRSIQRWLDAEGKYPAENSPEEYSFFANAAYPIEETRRKYFDNICKGKEPYIGYKILCELSKQGMVKTVFTTNFDGLTEKAAHQCGITPIPISLSNAEYIHRPASNTELLYVALHGDFKYGPLKNTSEELDAQHEDFVNALKQHLYDKHLIVIGYSGRDQSLMSALKEAYSESGGGMLFWCGFGHNMNDDVRSLLEYLKSHNRSGFYVATEGFDSTLVDIARTCYQGNESFHQAVEKHLSLMEIESDIKSPFTMEVPEKNLLLRSNLFPILLPGELFQVEVEFPDNSIIWETIRHHIADRKITAVPLKNCLYCFGNQSDIREAFSSIIKGDIRRTPVTYKEIKEGTAFRNLYLKTILQSLCELYGFETNKRNKIWTQASYPVGRNGVTYHVHSAFELSLFFDEKIFSHKPFAYLSVNPSFHIKSDIEVSRDISFELGKSYHDNLLKGQPNVKFNEQLQQWIQLLFSTGQRLQFDYPLLSGNGFKFSLSSDTMYAALMKTSEPKYRLNLPQNFPSKKIIHLGIQYAEPLIEFAGQLSGETFQDFHPMRGLKQNKPYDYHLNGNVFDPEINLAVICSSSKSQQLHSFLNRLHNSSLAGNNNPDYLIDYPGFIQAYGIPLNIPDPTSEYWQDCALTHNGDTPIKAAIALADSIKKSIDQLEATRKKMVIVIFVPSEWANLIEVEEANEKFDLHDYIKAYAAQKQVATQFIQESTLNDTMVCQLNWWLSLSFYVKSLRTPWILKNTEPDTAFVGLGYSVNHRSAKDKVVLGCSHIYNSSGQGLKYRLSKVDDCTFDRKNNPYLSYQDAYKFGAMIRELFLNATGEIPKRVVVHKRTHFKPDEIKGIVDSLGKTGIKQIDLIEINYEPDARFAAMFSYQNQIQPNRFPIPRGSCFLLDNYTALLWTHGVVPSVRKETNSYFQGGRGIPIPIKIRKHYGSTNISTVATEIMGLTKMNWNSFDLYSKLPATIQTSNEIARIGWLLNRFEGRTYDYRNFM